MTSPQMQMVVYDDFTGGESGRLGNIKAPANSYHSLNLMPYANGLLGPRPGLVETTPEGLPDGYVRHLATIPVPGAGGIVIIGRTVYHFDLYNPSDTASADATLLADVDGNDSPIPGKLFTAWEYITVPGDKTYKIDGSSVDPLTDSPGGVAIEIYGERMLIAESQASPRIFYNDPTVGGPFETWNGDFFDVGDRWQITQIREQRQGVTIYKGRQIFVLTGVPGVNAVLRPIAHTEPVLHPWQEDMDEDDISWFIPVFRDNVASFNGSRVEQVSTLQELDGILDESPDPTTPLHRGLIVVRGDLTTGTVVAVQDNLDNTSTVLMRHNGIWTRHKFDNYVSGMMAKRDDILTLTDGGSDENSARIFNWKPSVIRPGFIGDQFNNPGDLDYIEFDAWVEFPRWEAPDGKNVRVRSVTVDFQKYNTGSANTNHFDIEVLTVGAEDNPGYPGTSDSWDEDTSEAAADDRGTSARKIFRFHDDAKRGAGYELALRQVRGVAFKKIVVELEVFPMEPRT